MAICDPETQAAFYRGQIATPDWCDLPAVVFADEILINPPLAPPPVVTVTADPVVIVDNPPPATQTQTSTANACEFPWLLLLLAAVGGYYLRK